MEEDLIEEDDPETKDPTLLTDGHDMTKGAKLTLTFCEGLVIQVLPNGDIVQEMIPESPVAKSQTKGNNLVEDQISDHQRELKRIITTDGQVIKYMADGNFIIYFPDGTLTYNDNRKKVWYTINSNGVKRIRRIQDGTIQDELERLKISTKVDPETNATLHIREDGVLHVEYVDETSYLTMPDGT